MRSQGPMQALRKWLALVSEMFANMKIGMCLGLGAAVLAMLLVLGGMGLLQLRNVDNLSKDALAGKWLKVRLANKIIESVNANGRQVFVLIESGDRAAMDRSRAEMAGQSKQLTKTCGELEKLVDDEKSRVLYEAVLGACKPYMDDRKQALDLALDEKRDEAMRKFVSETLPLQKQYIDAIDALIAYQTESMDAAAPRIQAICDTFRNLVLGLSAFDNYR